MNTNKTKLKVFKFRVSNWTTDYDGTNNSASFVNGQKEVVTYEHIENVVNEFLANNVIALISLDVKPVVVHRHNNGHNDTIDLVYNIVYK